MSKPLSVHIAILVAVMLILQTAASAQFKEIRAKGYATIYGGDKAAARDRGIEDAQRNAVEQAMGTMISSETVIKNYQVIKDRILSLSSGYIENYRVLSEKEVSGGLEVEIAAIVGLSKLSESVDAVKNLLSRMDKPKIMVLVAEQSILEEVQESSENGKGEGKAVLSATNLGVTENVLIEYFRAKGFEFVDRQALAGQIEVADPLTLVNNKERVKKIANLTDAQVVIFGHAQARTTDTVHGIYSGQANISLRALKADTGEVIAAANSHAAVAFVDASTANTKALKKAAGDISKKLMGQIIDQWRSEFSGSRNISLVVKGVKYSDVKEFRGWLPKYVRGVKAVHQRSVKGGTAELDLEIQGSAENLADELSEKKFRDKSIEILGLTQNKVIVQFK